MKEYKISNQYKRILEMVHKVEPLLTSYGIDSRYKYKDYPIFEEEFNLCCQWLDEQTATEVIDETCTSDYLKHKVEHWVREHFESRYISEGAIIAAIIYRGIKYSRISCYESVCAGIKIKQVEKDIYVIPSPYIQYID